MKMFDLTGKAALVTGGNGGIGLGMAEGLAQAGATIAIAGRNAKKNAEAVAGLKKAGGKAIALEADLTDEKACRAVVDRAAKELGRLDILVNNAGMNIRKKPQDYTFAEWRTVLMTNLDSAFLASQAAYPHMVKAGGGKIINTGSMLSLFGGALLTAYGSSKGGIMQMTRSLAVAWAKENIQVNCILPGYIDTNLTKQARIDIQGLNERVIARTPVGRWGVPAEFAGIAVFLAAPASDFITGTAIPVDGGYSVMG